MKISNTTINLIGDFDEFRLKAFNDGAVESLVRQGPMGCTVDFG